MNKNSLEFSEKIEETMLGPLWARAKYSQLYPELLNDLKAIEIIKNVDYDFSNIETYLGEWRGLGLLVRAKNFDIAVKEFIENHPSATIVNIGAGLDTTFYRVDNGTIKWYDLDLPSAIMFRKKFLSESERNIFIPKSALDYSWFEEIKCDLSNGIFFIAGGFVYYFEEEKISSLVIEMTKRFPKAELIFDATSKFANQVVNLRAKKAGEKDLRFHFGVGNPTKIFPKWSSKIQLHDWYTIWGRTELNPSWSGEIISAIKKSERIKAAKIIHLKFVE